MSGFADTRSPVPPQPPADGGRTDGPAGIILTSRDLPRDEGMTRLAQVPPPAPRTPAGHTGATSGLTPAERERLFQRYLKNLAPREGGTANRSAAHDPGGLTHKGISAKFLNLYRKQNPQLNLPADPRQLTAIQREDITRIEFFNRAKVPDVAAIPGVMQQVPQLPEQLFDTAYLHGPEDAGKFLQRALDQVLGTDLRSAIKGKKAYDGIVGRKTRAAIAAAVKQNKLRDVNNAMAILRENTMKIDPKYPHNPGWTSRAKSFHASQP